ncbi:MAG: ABC-F family ATP-binding cassette domain-containing protein [Clostridiales Family XIII bacterium]|jgi:ATP-binding cassette subfamily F protein 3|nr:ABC-F family ATP-binding cassette domain-containing protein [Clostridiales Family XIII bacterium]
MIALSATGLSKSFGVSPVLEDVSFSVQKGERVGLIGANGAGKTTLLRILAGEEEASGGSASVSKELRVGFLRQDREVMSAEGVTLEDVMRRAYAEASAAGAEVFESEITGLLRALAFPDEMHDRPASGLSGGEKSRLAFAALLLMKPDVLLLDEPTNHLDIGTINWLEQYLAAFRGTVVLVTHDRFFLDRTVTRIVEMERGRAQSYPGSYTAYVEKKRALREEQMRAYEKNRQEIRRQEDLIRRFKERGTEKLAKRAASREKRLAHTERVAKPDGALTAMRMRLDEKNRSGTDVLLAEGLAKRFGARELFAGVDLDLKRAERVCMVGANGVGKTTLLRILLGRTSPDAGVVRKGTGVLMGYFSQEQRFEDAGRTVLEEMAAAYPLYSQTEMRNILAGFLFTGDSVFQPLASLSGGEKAKLALVKLLLSGANTLLLDEPTNHLDIPSKEAVEEALLAFPGTLLAVSHDRYFLNKIPTRIAELTPRGLVLYPGRYDYYAEKKAAEASGRRYLRELAGQTARGAGSVGYGAGAPGGAGYGAGAPGSAESAPSQSEAERRARKQRETEARRLTRRREEAEARIEALEAEVRATEDQLADPSIATDPEKLTALAHQLATLQKEVETAYALWEALASEE